jgi:hypothetical protein
MKKIIAITSMTAIAVASVIGCGASSSEEQRRAQTHQYNSDKAADRGNYGVAGEEQRAAADAHHEAVKKAIDEGRPIPPQTRRGDPPPPDPRR